MKTIQAILRNSLICTLICTVVVLLTACTEAEPDSTADPEPPAIADSSAPASQDDDDDDVTPSPELEPLEVGTDAPSATVRTPDGEDVDMADVYRDGPTVLIFYRGGWCPYCNTHLADLAQVEPQIRELDFQIIAISPDRPAALRESLDEHEINYQLLSDQDMTLAHDFGIAFRVDDETIEQYRDYDIDLEAASGRSHFQLPVPAVYIIDREGVIRFRHWDEDYTQRLSGEEIVAAAQRLSTEGE